MKALMVILLAIALVAFSFLGLAIRVLLKKGGRFPNTHVSGNRYLRSQGVYCSQTQDRLEQQKAGKNIEYDKLAFIPDKNAG